VAAFLAGRLAFPGIVDAVARVVDEHDFRERPTLSEVLETEEQARAAARRVVESEV
jgi:1-deoxy-D-xylulose-5-phosphate reductoisomerase